jgi:hypothetical protein
MLEHKNLPEGPENIDPESPAQRAARLRRLREVYGHKRITEAVWKAHGLENPAGTGRPRKRESKGGAPC